MAVFVSAGDWPTRLRCCLWLCLFQLVTGHQIEVLFVAVFVSAGDWLQGPHVYALYDSYGMTAHQIEVLFVAGFGSSMIFGTIVGSFADR